ncbi:MAG: hypothetical protein KDB14_21305 [Planctomycetales bacterium]|nr:hypothetical protein [Planctomycetales bacterium]
MEQLFFGELCYQTFGFEPAYLLPAGSLTDQTNGVDFCHVWGAKRANPNRLKSLDRLRAEHPELFWRIASRFGLQSVLDLPSLPTETTYA